MKNQLNASATRDFVAPYDVLSGGAFKVGAIVAVANYTASSGAAVTGDIRGAFSGLAKNTGEAWTAFTTVLYWDNSNKRFTSTSSGNTKCGVAAADALSADTTGSVELIQSI